MGSRGGLAGGALMLSAVLVFSCSKANEVNNSNDVCEQEYQDCNLDAADGCETNTAVNALHCGECGYSCGTANGVASCVAGSCEIECDAGFADCNERAGDGCEAELDVDRLNCGTCGRECAGPDSQQACFSGECSITSCARGSDDCDGDVDNGCEVDLDGDAQNCGECGEVCPSAGGTALCSSGSCELECETPCDGVCLDLTTDSENCGSCGFSCEGAACADGVCQPEDVVTGLLPLSNHLQVSDHGYFGFWQNDAEISKIDRDTLEVEPFVAPTVFSWHEVHAEVVDAVVGGAYYAACSSGCAFPRSMLVREDENGNREALGSTGINIDGIAADPAAQRVVVTTRVGDVHAYELAADGVSATPLGSFGRRLLAVDHDVAVAGSTINAASWRFSAQSASPVLEGFPLALLGDSVYFGVADYEPSAKHWVSSVVRANKLTMAPRTDPPALTCVSEAWDSNNPALLGFPAGEKLLLTCRGTPRTDIWDPVTETTREFPGGYVPYATYREGYVYWVDSDRGVIRRVKMMP